MYKILAAIATFTLCACASILTFRIAAFLDRMEKLPAQVTEKLAETIHDESSAIREDAMKAIGDTRVFLSAEIRSLRTDTRAEASATRDFAAQQVTVVVSRVDARLASLQLETLGLLDRQLTTTNSHIGAVADTVQQAPTDFKFATRWLWDCHQYAACLQSQTLGLFGSAKHVMGVAAQVAPEMAESSKRTAAASAKLSENLAEITKPRPLWQRIVNTAILSTPGIIAIAR